MLLATLKIPDKYITARIEMVCQVLYPLFPFSMTAELERLS